MADEQTETEPAELQTVDGSASSLARRPGGVVGAIQRVNRWLHYVAGGLLIFLTLITVANIAGRAFFNTPLPGAVELTEMLMVLVVYLGFGYAEHQGDHISVDLLYERAGRIPRLVLTIANGLVGFFVMGLLAWQLYQYAGVLAQGGYESSILQVPLAPLAMIAVAATVLFVFAMLATAIVSFRALREERS